MLGHPDFLLRRPDVFHWKCKVLSQVVDPGASDILGAADLPVGRLEESWTEMTGGMWHRQREKEREGRNGY